MAFACIVSDKRVARLMNYSWRNSARALNLMPFDSIADKSMLHFTAERIVITLRTLRTYANFFDVFKM